MSGVWVHRKGKHYLVLGTARDENSLGAHAEPQVVYVSLEADPAGPVMHTRSISEFLERFEPLRAGAPAAARHLLGA